MLRRSGTASVLSPAPPSEADELRVRIRQVGVFELAIPVPHLPTFRMASRHPRAQALSSNHTLS